MICFLCHEDSENLSDNLHINVGFFLFLQMNIIRYVWLYMQENWQQILNKYGSGILLHHFVRGVVTLVSNLLVICRLLIDWIQYFCCLIELAYLQAAVLQRWKGWWGWIIFCKSCESWNRQDIKAKHWTRPNQGKVDRSHQARTFSSEFTHAISSKGIKVYSMITILEKPNCYKYYDGMMLDN